MTMEVPVWYKDQWDTKVIQRFQAEGYLLKGMTEPPVKIDGETFHWLRTQKVDVGGPYIRGSEVQPLNPNDDQVTGSSLEWDAPFHIYDFDVTRMTPNEQDVRQRQASMALGRKSDHIVMDNLMAITLPSGQIMSAPVAAMTPYVFMPAIAAIFDNDVPDDDQLFCGVPAIIWEQLKVFRVFSDADYVGEDMPFVRREMIRSWNGCNFFRLPKHLYSYTTVSTANDTYRFRMWHKSALGAGHNVELRTEWQRQAARKRWFLNHTIDGCCVGLQTEGIYEFQVTVSTNVQPEVFPTSAVTLTSGAVTGGIPSNY